MKVNYMKRLLVLLVLAAMMLSVSCSRKDTAPSVKCYNGTFVGMTENGITSFITTVKLSVEFTIDNNLQVSMCFSDPLTIIFKP